MAVSRLGRDVRGRGFVSFTLGSLDPRVPGKAENPSASPQLLPAGAGEASAGPGGAQSEAMGMV